MQGVDVCSGDGSIIVPVLLGVLVRSEGGALGFRWSVRDDALSIPWPLRQSHSEGFSCTVSRVARGTGGWNQVRI